MRASKGWKGWLAAVLALALETAQGHFVNFTTGFEGSFQSDEAIFRTDVIGVAKFNWESSNVTVDEIKLFVVNATGAETQIGFGKKKDAGGNLDQPSDGQDTFHTSASSWNQEGAQETHFPEGPNNKRQAGGIGLIVESSETWGQVSFSDTPRIQPNDLGSLLYFQAKWSDGLSYSRPFAVVQDGRRFEQLSGGQFSNPAPYKEESGGAPGLKNDQTPTSTGSGNPTVTPGGLSGGEATTTPAAKSAGGGGGGGLSSGAVIGIAVACGVLGLILVFGLVWYLLRQRQQKKALLPVDSSYGGSGNRTDELMAEKEAAADVDVAPHSPYSDEGGGPGGAGPSSSSAAAAAAHSHGEAVAAGAVAVAAPSPPRPQQHLQDPPRSFTPYSDRLSASGSGGAAGAAAGTPSVRAASLAHTDDARASIPSPIPGRATPRGLTTPYAHLVEDGMTEDEIRRLEDEERQLDAAIEQAGRR